MERIFNNVKITSSFEKSETRENLVSGETIGQHFGKIAKVIDDLENGEFNCNLTIDNALSETSENPVQNKVINAALKSKANQTTVDNALAQKANLEYVNASLTGKSDTGHTHDDRYYTESEIDTKLNTKLNTSLKGAANGLAELDSSGKVPSAQLPSYVDDVLEYTNKTSFPATGESGKIYISQDNNKTYRWSGSAYVEISPSLALGETSATAYRGDRGKIAYDHSQTTHAPSNAQANVIETIKVNGTALTPSSKAVNITVPSVGNGTITIKQAGTTKGTFTTNQSGNTTIELTDSDTNTWRPLGTTADTACAGNDARLSNARPASDVYAWAKASSKPSYAWDEITSKPSTFTPSSHTHKYAGSSSVGGSATSAVKLDSSAGSATQPVYFSSGKPVATTYTLGASVPSGAKFTDTTYSAMTGATSSSAGKSGLVPAPASGKQGAYLRGDGTWAVPTNTDTKVTNTLNTTAKAYVTGTTSSSTNTGTQVFDTGVYLDTTPGMLTATTFKGALSGNASSSSKLVSSSYTTISIATSDWSTNSSGGYVCTKTLSSAMAYTNFNIDVVLSTDQSAAKLQIEAWNCIIADGRIAQTTSSGSTTAFTFYAFTAQPSVALTVGIQGVS